MAIDAPRPQKLAMIVAQQIVADINSRGNRPGDRLPPERAMLESYGVGRGTLRESLRYLELQGVISLRPGPGGGPVVQQPDASILAMALTLLLQFADAPYRSVAEARAGLEPVMAQLAATRISDDQLAELRLSVQLMGEDLDNEKVFLEQNKRFHDVIAHGSGNAMFGYLVDALLDILDGSALGIDYPQHRRPTVLEAHRRIYEAIASRDAAAAASAMDEHIRGYLWYAENKYPEVLSAPISWSGR